MKKSVGLVLLMGIFTASTASASLFGGWKKESEKESAKEAAKETVQQAAKGSPAPAAPAAALPQVKTVQTVKTVEVPAVPKVLTVPSVPKVPTVPTGEPEIMVKLKAIKNQREWVARLQKQLNGETSQLTEMQTALAQAHSLDEKKLAADKYEYDAKSGKVVEK